MKIILLFISFKEFCTFIDDTFTANFFYTFLKFLVIPMLLLVSIYLILAIILTRFFSDKVGEQKLHYEENINDFLTDLIFSNYSVTETKEKIVQFKKTMQYKHKWCRYSILDKLIHIKENLKEVNQNLILLIYKDFGLHNYSRNLINKRKWYFKSLGFYHYQSLDYKIKKSHIRPYLSSKNRYLKSNALIALIALSDEKFDILENYDKKISVADELKILDLIYQKKSTIPETINNWLDSKNASVVILAIKLIVRYRESICLPKITYLLKHPDDSVRKEIIVAIRELFIMDANEILRKQYAIENNFNNKKAIIKTLAIIGDAESEQFVSELIHLEKNIELKFQIIACVNKLNQNFFNNFKSNKTLEQNEIERIILHVQNPYLS